MRAIKKKRANLPKSLYHVRKRFDRWRRTHQPRARFSEELWSEAVAMAHEYGHNRTAQALGLDYYSLKKRLESSPAADSEKNKDTSSFIELIPPTQAECVIEIENCETRKMRIFLKGGNMPDLVSLIRNFCREEA